MSIEVKAGSLNEIPEVMRPYVTETDGKFVYDDENAMKGLVAERGISKSLKADKAKLEADLAKFTGLGKTAEELAELINSDAGSKLTEAEKAKANAEAQLRKMQTQLGELIAERDEAKKRADEAKLRAAVEGIIDQLPAEQEREKHRAYSLGGKTSDGLDIAGMYKQVFKLSDTGEIEDVAGKAAGEYLASVGKTLNFTKASNPGIAKPGTTTLGSGGMSAAYLAAKQSGNIGEMIANAPEKQ